MSPQKCRTPINLKSLSREKREVYHWQAYAGFTSGLKAYCARHGVDGGFVCYSVEEDALLITTDGFSERKTDACWKVLCCQLLARSSRLCQHFV